MSERESVCERVKAFVRKQVLRCHKVPYRLLCMCILFVNLRMRICVRGG